MKFTVRKGKWAFLCEVQASTLSSEANEVLESIQHLLQAEVVVTKRVSLPELRLIIDNAANQVPEFLVSYANTGSFDQFSQFSTYLSSRNRAGVATLSSDYWFILIPHDHQLKCMVVNRASAPPPVPAVAPVAIEPLVPLEQLQESTKKQEINDHATAEFKDEESALVADAMLGLQQVQTIVVPAVEPQRKEEINNDIPPQKEAEKSSIVENTPSIAPQEEEIIPLSPVKMLVDTRKKKRANSTDSTGSRPQKKHKKTPPDCVDLVRVHKYFHAMQYLVHGAMYEKGGHQNAPEETFN
ncbi:hypothetical protein THRCLA_20221 [Thraustotheca clavata]|uniref:Spen paralogue and orthologue SPOC C-terminal domain-containing protein n=1 Tax=Thraustotheca clavata TaxID=74557 RepID=A0A1W0A9Z4_9STRA|nr:hypothetical protein THRCLA_20221 [Thraustotheca clavata]